MKVLHIISGLGGGGRERRMSQLVKGLDDRCIGLQKIIVISDYYNDYKKDIPNSVDIISIGNKSKIRLLINLYECIKEYAPDVVHLWTEINLILFGVSIFKNILGFKLISGFIADGNPIKSSFSKILNRLVFRKSDAIVSNSKAGLLSKDANLPKSYVIYNGFNFDRLNMTDKIIPDVCENYSGKKIITMCARFSPAKDWQMFLDVALKIQEDYGDFVIFLAVGNGEYHDYYKEQTKNRNIHNVVFTGQRHDVEKILLNTDISLLFSNRGIHAEGVSNSIMESMAAGVPVIATAGGGTSEIITSTINGFIISPGNVKEAVNYISLLINDEELLKKLGENAKNEIKNRFLLSNMTSEYLDLYKTVCE